MQICDIWQPFWILVAILEFQENKFQKIDSLISWTYIWTNCIASYDIYKPRYYNDIT